jgi:phage terminase small subunit
MLLATDELTELLSGLLGYEIRFCREFMVDFNPVKALKRAEVQGAKSSAQKEALAVSLLKDTNIQKYLAHLKAKMEVQTGVTPDRILKELDVIAFQNITDVLQNDEKGNLQIRRLNDMVETGQIKKLKVKVDPSDGLQIIEMEMHDKLRALELRGKHEKMFTDRVDVTTNGNEVQSRTPVSIVINHRKPGEPLAVET